MAAIDNSLGVSAWTWTCIKSTGGDPHTPLEERSTPSTRWSRRAELASLAGRMWERTLLDAGASIDLQCDEDGTRHRRSHVFPIWLTKLLDRNNELEVAPMCLANDLGVLPWSPLGGGRLTRKHRAENHWETTPPDEAGRGAELRIDSRVDLALAR